MSPNSVHVNAPFSDALTITTTAGSVTKTFTGTLVGDFNTTQTTTTVFFNAPKSQDYTFAGLGTFTVGQLTYNPPGPTGSPFLGALSTPVTFKSAPVPEASSSVSLGLLLALGLGGR